MTYSEFTLELGSESEQYIFFFFQKVRWKKKRNGGREEGRKEWKEKRKERQKEGIKEGSKEEKKNKKSS